MKKHLKYCPYCGPEWVDWIVQDPSGHYCGFCGFSLIYNEPDPQERPPAANDLGRCPTCGDDYVISDNFICCRCDMYPI